MSMLVRHARDLARQWVVEEAGTIPGFYGAYFAGSINWLSHDDVLPETSDLDINVVISCRTASEAREKFVYGGVLLEITYLPLEQVRSPDMVLGNYHLAGGFAIPSVIADSSGHLTELQAAVSQSYARREWVRRRCEHAARRVVDGLAALDASRPLPEAVMGWLFPTGVTTHVLLVPGLKNPTVRRRYMAVRDLLVEYRQPAFHEELLALLGCDRMSRTSSEQHLAALIEVFDVAKTLIRSPFSFASDISDIARPLAIDGSRELIETGFHREAMFWIAVTYSRCQTVLAADAPAELAQRFDPGYRALLGDLGIRSFADLQERGERVRTQLPRIWEMAEVILAANPLIKE